MSPSEHDLQSQIIMHLNSFIPGCLCVEYYNGATFRIMGKMGGRFVGIFNTKNKNNRPDGFPDVIGVVNGKPFAIEVKLANTIWTSKTYASKEQKEMHEKMNSLGWKATVCRSITEAVDFVKSL